MSSTRKMVLFAIAGAVGVISFYPWMWAIGFVFAISAPVLPVGYFIPTVLAACVLTGGLSVFIGLRLPSTRARESY